MTVEHRRFRVGASAGAIAILLGLGVTTPAVAQETKPVRVVEEVCPPEIQTPAQWDPLHITDVCRPAARTGTVGPPPAGFTYDPEPLLFDLQLTVTAIDGTQTLADAQLIENEFCAPGGTTCQVGRSYRWNVESGPTVIHVDTVPAGYRFGFARGDADETADVNPTVDVAARTISFDLDDWSGVTIFIAHFTLAAEPGPTARPTVPATSTLEADAGTGMGTSPRLDGRDVAIAAGAVALLALLLRPRNRRIRH